MATRYVLQTFDDLDGAPIADGDGGRVTFSLGDDRYEIDLSAENTRAMYAALAPYIAAARTIDPRSTSRRASASRTPGVNHPDAVRAWGRAHGHVVADRGRLPGTVLRAYAAAQT